MRAMAHLHAHDNPCCTHAPASIAQRLALAEAACSRRGARLTEQRRQVLAALLEAGRAVGAYDLIESVAARAGKRIAPITIYRALDFLVENDLVHRIESRNAFLACPGGHGAHPQAVFMICDTCGRVGEAMSAPLEIALQDLAGMHGFAARSRIIELKGVCADCAGSGTTP